tara:strand:+ start:400 stop:738 length:339 start_codon:yes stop_codon:yes gene_type:complete
MINKFAYFAKGSDMDAAGDAIMVPVDNFVGAEISLDDVLLVNFKAVAAGFSTVQSVFSVSHEIGKSREAIEQIAAAFASTPKNGFISMVDVDNKDFAMASVDAGIFDVIYSL